MLLLQAMGVFTQHRQVIEATDVERCHASTARQLLQGSHLRLLAPHSRCLHTHACTHTHIHLQGAHTCSTPHLHSRSPPVEPTPRPRLRSQTQSAAGSAGRSMGKGRQQASRAIACEHKAVQRPCGDLGIVDPQAGAGEERLGRQLPQPSSRHTSRPALLQGTFTLTCWAEPHQAHARSRNLFQ